MGLFYNGKEVDSSKDFIYNGQALDKVIVNNEVVWEKGLFKIIPVIDGIEQEPVSVGSLTATMYDLAETKMPLTSEQCCGWFLDEDLVIYLDYASYIGDYVEGIGAAVKLYTRTATPEKLNFVLNDDNESYYITAKSTTISGIVVVPRKYNSLIVNSFAPKTVNGSFKNCYNITKCCIPATIDSIGYAAFYTDNNDTVFSSINLHSNITGIGALAFQNKQNIQTVEIPSSCEIIGMTAFANCGMKTLYLGSALHSFYSNTFAGCANLESIAVDVMNNEIYSQNNCVITSDTKMLILGCSKSVIPYGVTQIYEYAFSGQTKLTAISIPSSVTEINSYAFQGCTGLEKIYLTGTITTIGSYAFNNNDNLVIYCSMSSKPSGWASNWNYKNSSSSATITTYWNVTNSAYNNLNNLVFALLSSGVYSVAGIDRNISGDIFIPGIWKGKQVKRVEANGFLKCTNITTLRIAENITTIDEYAFQECKLTTVYLPASLQTVGSYAFAYDSYITSVAFLGVSQLTSIGYNAFRECSSLTEILIPTNVSSIGNYAFYGCSKLTNVTLPPTLETIGIGAFQSCIKLSNLNFEDTNSIGVRYFTGVEYETIARSAMYTNKLTANVWAYSPNWSHCGNNTMRILSCTEGGGWNIGESSGGNIAFAIYDGGAGGYKSLVSSKTFASLSAGWHMFTLVFDGTSGKGYIDGDLIVTGTNFTNAPNGTISYNANNAIFVGAEAAGSATIPASERFIGMIDSWQIGNEAWSASTCKSIYNNNKANKTATWIKLKTIGETAFYGCTALTKIGIPNTVTSLGAGAFQGCNLNAVYFNAASYTSSTLAFSSNTTYSLTVGHFTQKINDNLFANSAVSSANILTGCTAIGNDAFVNCNHLTTITIPASVKTIGERAFQKCYNLATVNTSASFTEIKYCAFALTNIVPSSNLVNSTTLGQGCFATRKSWIFWGNSLCNKLRATDLGTLTADGYTGYGKVYRSYAYHGWVHSSGANSPGSPSIWTTFNINTGIGTYSSSAQTTTTFQSIYAVYNTSLDEPGLSCSYTESGISNYAGQSAQVNNLGWYNDWWRIDYQINIATTSPCLATGTEITLADGNTKLVENVTYNDLLKVYNFETGKYDYQYPLAIMHGETHKYKRRITFDDRTYLDICGHHDIYDPIANIFRVYGDNAITRVGKNNYYVLYEKDDLQIIKKIISIKKIRQKTKSYGIITSGTITAFANHTLMGMGLLNKTGITTKNMFPETFKQDKLKAYSYKKFNKEIYDKSSKYLTLGLNLNYVDYYQKDNSGLDILLEPFKDMVEPNKIKDKYECTIGFLDGSILTEVKCSEDKVITLPEIKSKKKSKWYVVGEYKYLNPGDKYKVNFSTIIRTV